MSCINALCRFCGTRVSYFGDAAINERLDNS